MILKGKKEKHGGTPTRKRDHLMTLKTREIVGPGKDGEDPVVILEEDIYVDSANGKKSWKRIEKSLTQ